MTETILPLLIFLLPLAYSPGPGNLFFAALGARSGVAAAVPALAGYHLATVVVTVLIGLGFAGAVAQSGELAQVMRYLGAAYVLHLAWRFATADTTLAAGEPRSAGFGSGVLLLVLNPKAYVIVGLMFSQFLDGEDGWQKVMAISILFTLNNLLAFTLWTTAGDRIRVVLRSEATVLRLNLLFAAMLATVAIWMAMN